MARILAAGVLVGILDGLFAIALYVLALKVTTPWRLFQSIASAVLGPESFQGGRVAAGLGLFLHFAVAHAWSAVYFVTLRVSPLFRRLVASPGRAAVVGMAYGILVWLVMDLLVIPMTRTRPTPVTAPSFLYVLIGHMFVVGLPIALVLRPQPAGTP